MAEKRLSSNNLANLQQKSKNYNLKDARMNNLIASEHLNQKVSQNNFQQSKEQ
jgi:hypothetical protein